MKAWEGQASSGLRTIRQEHLIARLPESVSHCVPAVITPSSSKSQGSAVSGAMWATSGYIKLLKCYFFFIESKVNIIPVRKNWLGKAVLFGDFWPSHGVANKEITNFFTVPLFIERKKKTAKKIKQVSNTPLTASTRFRRISCSQVLVIIIPWLTDHHQVCRPL